MYYWAFMVIAIVTEVIGTLSMKFTAEGSPLIGLSVMYIMLILSYSSLAIAVQRIPLAVAYGAWESLGLVLIAIFSFLLFGEPLGIVKISAIALIIGGMLLLHYGTESKEE
jgi:spermidine export protein MdtJ